jgi:hypothetical protein
MIRLSDHFVLVPRMTPIEARLQIIASWTAHEPVEPQHLWIEGTVKGPICEYSTTLSGRSRLEPEFVAERASPASNLKAHATILDPCYWEPQHPFCYEIDLELRDDERVLDRRHILTGLRHLTVESSELLLNGRPYFLQGVRHPPTASIAELEAWHEANCQAFLVQTTPELCERTDRWGPLILHLLPPMESDARDQVVRLRNHPSLLVWVVPDQLTGEYLATFAKTIRSHDPSRPIGQFIPSDRPLPAEASIDVFLLRASHVTLASEQCLKPYIVLGPLSGRSSAPVGVQNLADAITEFRDRVGLPPGLVGLIL